MARPSKKDKINHEALKLLYNRGFTDKEVALCLHITEQTLNNWKLKDPEFFESLKDWKINADNHVERSLYERACGYSCPETKPQWVEEYYVDGETGKSLKRGRWEYAEMVKHYPPDPTSMIFWLKNRQPNRWQDKREVEHSGSIEEIIRKVESSD